MAQLRQVPREIHKHIRGRSYIGGSALGVSDGLVTNLAFLSGFAAIDPGRISLIQVAGLASMLAGAIRMFISWVSPRPPECIRFPSVEYTGAASFCESS